jgi:hypothetical protein
MKHSFRTVLPILAGFFLLVILPGVASACSACLGNPNSKAASAFNDALFLMLGVVGFMLSVITLFIFTLRKRAQAAMPSNVQIGSMMTAQENAK